MEKFYFFNSFLDTARAIEDDSLRLEYLMAVAEYWLEEKESDNPLIKALMVQTKFTLDRSKELSQQKSDSMKWNQNAVKTFEKGIKQRKTEKSDKNSEKQKKQEEEVEEEIEVEVEEENKKKEKNTKKKFLDFVLLSDDEYNKLVNQFWVKHTDALIDKLNNYIWSTGKRYKSHYFTILNWSKNETNTRTDYEQERQAELHRQKIREQIESFNSQPKQNATSNQTGWYNWRENIRIS